MFVPPFDRFGDMFNLHCKVTGEFRGNLGALGGSKGRQIVEYIDLDAVHSYVVCNNSHER